MVKVGEPARVDAKKELPKANDKKTDKKDAANTEVKCRCQRLKGKSPQLMQKQKKQKIKSRK